MIGNIVGSIGKINTFHVESEKVVFKSYCRGHLKKGCTISNSRPGHFEIFVFCLLSIGPNTALQKKTLKRKYTIDEYDHFLCFFGR